MDSALVKRSENERPKGHGLPEHVLDIVADYIGEIEVHDLHLLRFWLCEPPVPVMVKFSRSYTSKLYEEIHFINLKEFTTLGFDLHELLKHANAKHITVDIDIGFKDSMTKDVAAVVLSRALSGVALVKAPFVKCTHLNLRLDKLGHVINFAPAIQACTSLELDITNEDSVEELPRVLQVIGRATRLVRLSFALDKFIRKQVGDKCSLHELSSLKQLHFLELNNRLFDQASAESLVECLINRPNIKHLSFTFYGGDDACLLAKHLETNTSLEFLQCEFCGFENDNGEKCIDELMKALCHNRTLKTLYVPCKERSVLKTETVESVAAMIKANNTLISLTLSSLLEGEGVLVGQALATNTTIQRFQFSQPMRPGYADAASVQQAMKDCRTDANVVIEGCSKEFDLSRCSPFPYFKYQMPVD